MNGKHQAIYKLFHFAWKEAWPKDLTHGWQLMA